MDLLKQIAVRIAAAETPKEVIEVVLATFAEVLHYNTAVVFFFDASLTNLNIFRTSGMKAGVERYVMDVIPKRAREFLALMEASGMQPVVWDDTSVEENVFFDTGIFRSLFWLPVVVHKRLIGVIGLAWEKAHGFDKRYLPVFSILGNLLGGELQKLQQSFRTIDAQRERITALEEELTKHSYRENYSRSVVGHDPKMKAVYGTVAAIADVDVNVLIEGETGTGKELIADDIHFLSHRREGPLVKVNCGALSETLLESELFGHVKGSFTGAYRDRLGRFEMAHRGTLFLDEIGEMSLNMQVKLLRVLQEGRFERVGESNPRESDVRVICATNRNLPEAIDAGSFRKDLYYRLNVISIRVPPLRERMSDIPLLLEFFVAKYNRRYHMDVEGVSRQVLDKCYGYGWPGNIRELEHVIERAVVTYKMGIVEDIDVPGRECAAAPAGDVSRETRFGEAKRQVIAAFEREFILRLLAGNNGSIVRSAREAGLNRKNFSLKMKKYGIAPPPVPGR